MATLFRIFSYTAFLFIILTASLAALAQQTEPTVHTEILILIDRLESSGCQFYRNGSWYIGRDAKVHLLKKLKYIEERTTLQNTEQFISLGASVSSWSGKPYQVKCGESSPVDSQLWLTQVLIKMRTN